MELRVTHKLNTGNSHLCTWKTSLKNPDPDTLPEIAKILGVSLTWLVTGKNSDTSAEPQLPEDETILLEKYNGCNAIGKDRIQEYAGMMSREYPINLSISRDGSS